MAVPVGRMHGKLGWGQREDGPAPASVHLRHAERASEEPADFLGLRGEHDRMDPVDHVVILTAEGHLGGGADR